MKPVQIDGLLVGYLGRPTTDGRTIEALDLTPDRDRMPIVDQAGRIVGEVTHCRVDEDFIYCSGIATSPCMGFTVLELRDARVRFDGVNDCRIRGRIAGVTITDAPAWPAVTHLQVRDPETEVQ